MLNVTLGYDCDNCTLAGKEQVLKQGREWARNFCSDAWNPKLVSDWVQDRNAQILSWSPAIFLFNPLGSYKAIASQMTSFQLWFEKTRA